MYIEETNAIIEKLQGDENNAIYADDLLEINSIVAKAVDEIKKREKEVEELTEKVQKLQDANYELLKKAIVVPDEREDDDDNEIEEISLDEIDI